MVDLRQRRSRRARRLWLSLCCITFYVVAMRYLSTRVVAKRVGLFPTPVRRISNSAVADLARLAHSRKDEYGRIILTAFTIEFASILQNFVCNMKTVEAYPQLLIVALDKSAYSFAVRLQLPVWWSTSISNDEHSPVYYRTPKYNAVTKMKSFMTLLTLMQGVSVLFSDPDVIWFEHPLKAIPVSSIDIMIQSDALRGKHIARHPNSGLYFVRSNERTVKAFEDIVVRASNATDLSEQPNFRAILCYTRQRSLCRSKNEATTTFLPLASFPNGGYKLNGTSVFDVSKNRFEETSGVPLQAAHNNYIIGTEAKIKRASNHGDWFVEGNGCKSYT